MRKQQYRAGGQAQWLVGTVTEGWARRTRNCQVVIAVPRAAIPAAMAHLSDLSNDAVNRTEPFRPVTETETVGSVESPGWRF